MKQIIDVHVDWFGALDAANVRRFKERALPWLEGLEDRSWWKYTSWGSAPCFDGKHGEWTDYKNGLWLYFHPDSAGDMGIAKALADILKKVKCHKTLIADARDNLEFKIVASACDDILKSKDLPPWKSREWDCLKFGADYGIVFMLRNPVIAIGPHRRLFKYIPANYGVENLVRQLLKVSLLEDVNDPNEWMFRVKDGRTGRSWSWRRTAKLLRQTEGRVRGLISFSEDEDSRWMWEKYAARHAGLMLEFEVPESQTLLPIAYTDEWLELQRKDVGNPLSEERYRRIYFRKNARWADEREQRLVVPLVVAKYLHGLPFLPYWACGVHLLSVTFGSRASRSLPEVVRSYFKVLSRGWLKLYRRNKRGLMRTRCYLGRVKGCRPYWLEDSWVLREDADRATFRTVRLNADYAVRPLTANSGPAIEEDESFDNAMGLSMTGIIDNRRRIK